MLFTRSRGALRDAKYFSWTNNMRLVKKNPGCEESTAVVTKIPNEIWAHTQ